MNKKIIGIGILCLFLIAGIVNAVQINEKIETQNEQPKIGLFRKVAIGKLKNVEITCSDFSLGEISSFDNGKYVFYGGIFPVFFDVKITGNVDTYSVLEFSLGPIKENRNNLNINTGDNIEIYFPICLKTDGYIAGNDIHGWLGTVISPSIKIL